MPDKLVVCFVVGGMLTSAAWGQTLSLPAPTGPYAVGRVVEDWLDGAREDVLAPMPGVHRELPVTIWYPAAGGGSPAGYYPPALRNEIARRETAAPNPSPVKADQIRGHAFNDAPLAGGAKRFPVVVMKPAFGLFAVQYSVLAEDLASHGYFVVGSDSPYTTPFVVYQSGKIVVRSERGAPRDRSTQPDPLAPGQPNGSALPVLKVWVDDDRFMLDRIATLDTSGRFRGRLDLEAVGALGHSFGGATALQFCREDNRCKAAIDLDGAPLGDVVRTGLSKPSLFILSDRPSVMDRTRAAPDERDLLTAIDTIRSSPANQNNLAMVKGSAHFNFSDAALFTDLEASRKTKALGDIDPAQALAAARNLVRALFDRELKHEASATLEGAAKGLPVEFAPLR